MKPRVTLMTFIQSPDFGAAFNSDGNIAKSVKGMAKAMAKPSIPMVGATMLPCVDTATRRNPMIGPVQENDTKASVNAIRKIESMPVVFSDFASILFDHEEGRVNSNAPKKDAAKSTSSRQKKMLTMALVASAFKAMAPNNKVTAKPSNT